MKNNWKDHWIGMPEYINEKIKPYRSLKVNFATEKDLEDFAVHVGQKITDKTKSISIPKKPFQPDRKKHWIDPDQMDLEKFITEKEQEDGSE